MYTFESRIRFSETDSTGRLSLTSLIDYFQDITTFQSEDLGLGVSYMKSINQIWVLSGWQIEIYDFPRLSDYVRIVTAPHDFKGFMGSRNYALYGTDGKTYAMANSQWSLLSMDTFKPVNINEEMIEKYVLAPPLPMEYPPRKIHPVKNGEKKTPIVIGPYHLDTNHHVNNNQYIRMAQSFLPEDFTIGKMRAEYRKQAFLGDVVLPVVGMEDEKTVVSLETEEGRPYVVVEFTGRV